MRRRRPCEGQFLSHLLLLSACGTEKPTGTVTIDGSATIYPLSQAMAEAFPRVNPDVKLNVAFSGTGGGFRKFCAGQVDIEAASRAKTCQPLSRPLLLYTGAASRAATIAFVRFYLSPANTGYVTNVGYVPLPNVSLAAQTQRFDQGVTGSALGGHGPVLGINLIWLQVDEQEKIKNQLVQ